MLRCGDSPSRVSGGLRRVASSRERRGSKQRTAAKLVSNYIRTRRMHDLANVVQTERCKPPCV